MNATVLGENVTVVLNVIGNVENLSNHFLDSSVRKRR